jgi:hypothetical protein
MPEGGGLAEAEQGFEQQGTRHCRDHDGTHDKDTLLHRGHTSLAQTKKRADSVWLIGH